LGVRDDASVDTRVCNAINSFSNPSAALSVEAGFKDGDGDGEKAGVKV
jgi:hypothetical protein